MDSQYSTPWARWAVALAMVVYAMGAGVAPIFHFAEDGAEVNEYLVAMSEFHGADAHAADDAPRGEPLPPPHHVPDDVDCLLCLVMTSPAGVESPELAPDGGIASPVAIPFQADSFGPTQALPRANPARAPPRA